MADKPRFGENKSQADQLKEVEGLGKADEVVDKTMPPMPPAQPMQPMPPMGMGQPSMYNPLWQLAARLNGVSPHTGMVPPAGPPPPWMFQQGSPQLPPAPQGAGMPLPQ